MVALPVPRGLSVYENAVDAVGLTPSVETSLEDAWPTTSRLTQPGQLGHWTS